MRVWNVGGEMADRSHLQKNQSVHNKPLYLIDSMEGTINIKVLYDRMILKFALQMFRKETIIHRCKSEIVL